MSTTRLSQAGIGVKAYGVFLPKDPAVAPPEPPVVVESFGGGFYDVSYVKRRRTVQEERELLGIIPRRVKKIVQAVAKATVKAEKTDGQAERLLAQRLAAQEIESQAKYVRLMQLERDRLLSRDIDISLRIKAKRARDEEDEREAEMLLM